MIPSNSLRFRLIGAAVLVIILALLLAGATLLLLFERHVTRAVDAELDAALDQIAAAIVRDERGVRLTSDPADPRTLSPLGGRYWQVCSRGVPLLRSRSLWDSALKVPGPEDPKLGVRRLHLEGPDKQDLYAHTRAVILEPGTSPDDEAVYSLTVATNAAEIKQLKADFGSDVATALAIIGAFLLLAAWAQVHVGLAPFEAVRHGIRRVRIGEAQRLESHLPAELQPLIAETNRLLEAQERAIGDARGRAGDLAHGLKTPLTALTVLLDKLRGAGLSAVAGEFERQLGTINRHVERELARARIAAGAGVVRRTRPAAALAGLLDTMDKLPRGNEIAWSVSCDPALSVPVEEADLTEILGNLLDNARKWARTKVYVEACGTGRSIEIAVHDDGPGVADEDRARVLRRGARLDESRPGSGLGLTIVNDIVQAYGGTIALGVSSLGGLSVRITFSEPAQA